MPSSESKTNSSSSDLDFDEKKSSSSSESKETLSLKKSTRADSKDASKDAGEGDNIGSDIVSKVIAFFFDGDEFAQTFERFAETHCRNFDLDSEEMKLKYTDIYNQFLELFGAKLGDSPHVFRHSCVLQTAYIVSQGSSMKEFYRLVRHVYESDRESSIVLCSEVLVATADFDMFVLVMK